MLKHCVAAVSIAALAFGLAATSAFAADKPVYGVLMKTLSNPFWGAMEKGVDEGARKAGVDIFLQAVESDQAAEPQLDACNTMLQKKPAAMITAAINSTILLPCLKQANEMKIPVVDLDNNLDPAITKKAGVDVAFHIGSDNEAAGAKAADYLVSVLGQDAKGPMLVIEGLSGNITGEKRAHGFAEELKKKAPGLNIVASLPGDWDSLKAANITNDTLQRTPDLVAIFCANDDMALGSVEAARSAGKDKLIVIGVDGNVNAVKSIKAGRLNASVAQLPYLVGMQAVENVKKVLAGEKVPEMTYVPTLVLTKQVIEENKDPLLQYVK
ncbi:MAG TPA: substrate-binding domain-containing protein [Roseiarcus sp.]|nr:substrate-binding domain-containing protein [Roseiarcus sp.]